VLIQTRLKTLADSGNTMMVEHGHGIIKSAVELST